MRKEIIVTTEEYRRYLELNSGPCVVGVRCTCTPLVARIEVEYGRELILDTSIFELIRKNRAKFKKQAELLFSGYKEYVGAIHIYQNGNRLVVDVPFIV